MPQSNIRASKCLFRQFTVTNTVLLWDSFTKATSKASQKSISNLAICKWKYWQRKRFMAWKTLVQCKIKKSRLQRVVIINDLRTHHSYFHILFCCIIKILSNFSLKPWKSQHECTHKDACCVDRPEQYTVLSGHSGRVSQCLCGATVGVVVLKVEPGFCLAGCLK